MSQSTPSRGRGSGRHNNRGRGDQRAPQGGGRGGGASPQPAKVHSGSGVPFGYVPAYLPGSASLVEELNQRVMIVLRDGKHLVGVSQTESSSLSAKRGGHTPTPNLLHQDSLTQPFFYKTLASYDQFSNMILQDSMERRIINSEGVCYYHDVPLGTYILRGDSMVFMGQVNGMKEQMVMREVSLEELEKIERKEAGEEPLNWDFDADLIA